MVEEVEIQTQNDIQSAERRKTYTELAEENQRLIDENTQLTREAMEHGKENNKLLKELLKVVGEKK